MRTQDEKIKGFNLLELIVVVVIIGVISAVGYPNFSKWRKDREARDAVIKIKTLIQGIYSQTQRGQYAFVQVHISEEADGADRNLIVTSKGMKPQTLANLLNDEDSDWWIARDDPETDTTFIEPDYANICQIEDDPSLLRWDDDPDQGSDNIEVRQIIFKNVTTNWTDTTGAICFGKNDRWFSGNGQLASENDNDVVVDNYLFICDRSNKYNTSISCNVNGAGTPDSEHGYLYAIEWSRFGNITYEKFKNTYQINPQNGEKEWTGGNWVAQ